MQQEAVLLQKYHSIRTPENLHGTLDYDTIHIWTSHNEGNIKFTKGKIACLRLCKTQRSLKHDLSHDSSYHFIEELGHKLMKN